MEIPAKVSPDSSIFLSVQQRLTISTDTNLVNQSRQPSVESFVRTNPKRPSSKNSVNKEGEVSPPANSNVISPSAPLVSDSTKRKRADNNNNDSAEVDQEVQPRKSTKFPSKSEKQTLQKLTHDTTVQDQPGSPQGSGQAGTEQEDKTQGSDVEDEVIQTEKNIAGQDYNKEENEEENEEEDEAARILRAEKDKQLQMKPAKLRTWEESGKDIRIGKLVRELCYDEDDPLLAQQTVLENPEIEPNLSEAERSWGPDIPMSAADTLEENRQRYKLKAKKEVQKMLEQMDPTKLQMAYQFFKHDPNMNSIDVAHRIKQDGALRAYQQHQLVAIFFIMWVERHGTPEQVARQEAALGGGVLGDEPGFGKVSPNLFFLSQITVR
jgi:hypothetical protein